MSKNYDFNFYITCATVIPVLFVAIAVQGGPYESVLRSWHAAQQNAVNSGWAMERILASLKAFQAAVPANQQTVDHEAAGQNPDGDPPDAGHPDSGHPATAAPAPKRWRWARVVGATFAYPLLGVIAGGIVAAGGFGEGLALYVLYRGSEQPGQREQVLWATLVLVLAIVIGPFLTYMRRSLRAYISGIKLYASVSKQYLSFLRESYSALKQARSGEGASAANDRQGS